MVGAVLSSLLDLATVVHAGGHLSFCLFGAYPFALSPAWYLALHASDALLHLLLWGRDGEPLHLALYASHLIKRHVPLLRSNRYLNCVDAAAYLHAAVKIKNVAVFMLGCASYGYMKIRGFIW